MALVPVLLIVTIFAVVGVLGFGGSTAPSKEQVQQEVAELLDGIPQNGAILGSSRAPITLWVYGDLECPTVKIFVEKYLPSIIDSWVRTGVVKLDYRSFETDTLDERIFFEQETAALAAGRQDRMWNFLLTFVREQGEVRTDYVTEEFLTDIASQVPGLELAQWRSDRDDALLAEKVALSVQSGHADGISSTPSFSISLTSGEVDQRIDLKDKASIKGKVEASLREDIESLGNEAFRDSPTLKVLDPNL